MGLWRRFLKELGEVRRSLEWPSQSLLGPLASVGSGYKTKPQNFSQSSQRLQCFSGVPVWVLAEIPPQTHQLILGAFYKPS